MIVSTYNWQHLYKIWKTVVKSTLFHHFCFRHSSTCKMTIQKQTTHIMYADVVVRNGEKYILVYIRKLTMITWITTSLYYMKRFILLKMRRSQVYLGIRLKIWSPIFATFEFQAPNGIDIFHNKYLARPHSYFVSSLTHPLRKVKKIDRESK